VDRRGTLPCIRTLSRRFVVEIVNRTQKGDRLPLAQIDVPRVPVSDASLPEGCDSLVSSLTRSDLARIAGRCVS
jgi:hypothetical protein